MDSMSHFEKQEITTQPSRPPEFWSIMLPDEMVEEGFSLKNIIGSGSTGMVYKAIQTKVYAVKVIQWTTDSTRDIARHEYETGKQFDHCKETLHSLNYYEQNMSSFIIMEYGIPCLDYFTGRDCSIRDILITVLRVSKALETIHAAGYTHFDVKPENIMMVNGEAKLADFSHCSQFSCNQIYNRPMGTSAYKAPEIVAGGKHTGREDMYSLGILLFVLLMAGRLPFDFSRKESGRREPSDKIESLFIHPELLSIIQRAAAYDASDRYPGFEEFSNDIQSFMRLHDAALDEKMPQYRMHPSLQQTALSSDTIWDGFEPENAENKS